MEIYISIIGCFLREASLNNPTPLHFELKGPRLDLLESSEIKLAIRNNRNILNNQLDIKKQPIIDTICIFPNNRFLPHMILVIIFIFKSIPKNFLFWYLDIFYGHLYITFFVPFCLIFLSTFTCLLHFFDLSLNIVKKICFH